MKGERRKDYIQETHSSVNMVINSVLVSFACQVVQEVVNPILGKINKKTDCKEGFFSNV